MTDRIEVTDEQRAYLKGLPESEAVDVVDQTDGQLRALEALGVVTVWRTDAGAATIALTPAGLVTRKQRRPRAPKAAPRTDAELIAASKPSATDPYVTMPSADMARLMALAGQVGPVLPDGTTMLVESATIDGLLQRIEARRALAITRTETWKLTFRSGVIETFRIEVRALDGSARWTRDECEPSPWEAYGETLYDALSVMRNTEDGPVMDIAREPI